MTTDEDWKAEFQECLTEVMYAKPHDEIEAVRKAVVFAIDRRWLGATAATRAGRLLAEGIALEAARLLVPAGWSVSIGAVDLQVPGRDIRYVRDLGALERSLLPVSTGFIYVAQSAPEGIPTDPMAIRFGPEDACHMPDHGFETAALALCGEAMMLQLNIEEVGRKSLQ
jgi:hypothetical protein